MILIVAPHPDDELIGCYSLIHPRIRREDVTVVTDSSTDPDRLREFIKASEALEFRPVVTPGYTLHKDELGKFSRILVPAIDDTHEDHKKVNRLWRAHATSFYSVSSIDKGSPIPFPDEKRKTLDACYPSQKALWRHDHKFFLFERIRASDVNTYLTYTRSLDGDPVEVTALHGSHIPDFKDGWTDKDIINALIAFVPKGRVVVRFKDHTLEIEQ